MRVPRSPNRARAVLLAAAIVVAGGSGIAWASGTDPVIQACVSVTKGTVRVVSSPEECGNRETPLSWNQQGQPGPQGEPGTDGADGVDGVDGVDATAAFAGWGCPLGNQVTGFTLEGKPRCSSAEAIYDADGDRFGVADDCDDTNRLINPSIHDIGGNGIDENCDGSDGPAIQDCDDGSDYTQDVFDSEFGGCIYFPVELDQDSDGYTAIAATGTYPDCDDTNRAVHPGASEVPGNDVDENCDGVID